MSCSGSADHRDLHSFPTRRSSDLTEPKCRRSARLRAGPIPSTESSGEVSAFRARTLRWCVIAKRCASSRSEEHTSELQSQFHLVCRLLLEKKKRERRPQRARGVDL